MISTKVLIIVTSSVLISLYCTSVMSGAVICGLEFLWSSSAYSGPPPTTVEVVCGSIYSKQGGEVAHKMLSGELYSVAH